MKLFIWHGGQGDYHDSATVAILANSVNEARQIVAENKVKSEAIGQKITKVWDDFRAGKITEEEKIRRLTPLCADSYVHGMFNNTDVVAREPSEVLDTDKPVVAVVNSGCDC